MDKPYTGKILMVDLERGIIEVQTIADEVYRRFLSGLGLGAYILYDAIPPGADPLGPENVLGFVSGLLTGTGSLFAGRWLAVGKSPLTGTWGDANCGGYFSPAIKRTGYDGIFFRGVSPEPVYLFIDDKSACLKSASDLWGMDTIETERVLIERHAGRPRPSVACIGPAGEQLSLISGICHDGGRMAARSGLGAVMGSKRLKAVVLQGSQKIGCFNRERVKELSRRCARFVKIKVPLPGGWLLPTLGIALRLLPVTLRLDGILLMLMYKKWGTSSLNRFSLEWGDAPVKNWAGSDRDFSWRKAASIDPDRLLEQEKRKYHCYSCPLGCGGILNQPGEDERHKPEYETIMAFGGMLLNNDLDTIIEINDMLNRAGMDSISAGGAVALAIEAYEQGVITGEETGHLELNWGNAGAIKELLARMIRREGIGDLLADGVHLAAERLGRPNCEAAVHAGGQEIAMHDPRLDPGYGIHAAVEPTPGRHTTGSWNYYNLYQLWKKVKGKPRPPLIASKGSQYRSGEQQGAMAVANSCFTQLYNGAGICLFGALLGIERVPVFDWLNAATGWGRTQEEYMDVGRRIQTLRQMFNLKQGIDPRSVRVSTRALGLPPQKKGANRGRSVDLQNLRWQYWQQIGWDPETGIPLEKSLRELGL